MKLRHPLNYRIRFRTTSTTGCAFGQWEVYLQFGINWEDILPPNGCWRRGPFRTVVWPMCSIETVGKGAAERYSVAARKRLFPWQLVARDKHLAKHIEESQLL